MHIGKGTVMGWCWRNSRAITSKRFGRCFRYCSGGQGIVPSRFPKTRRAVRDVQGNAVYPLGWVQLSVLKSEMS